MNTSPEQCRAAIAKANKVRSMRAQAKKRVKRGEISVTRILATPPSYMAGMTVEDLLCQVPCMGPTKVPRVLRLARVSPSRRLKDLTRSDRLRILFHIRDRYPGVWQRIGAAA